MSTTQLLCVVLFVLVAASPILAFVGYMFWRATPPPLIAATTIEPGVPFSWVVAATGKPLTLWIRFEQDTGMVTSHAFGRAIGLWGDLAIDGRPVRFSAGDHVPPGWPHPATRRYVLPRRGGGVLSASTAIVDLDARAVGQQIRVDGAIASHAILRELRLWISRKRSS